MKKPPTHTPRPWIVTRDDKGRPVSIGRGRYLIATLSGSRSGKNANLIAAAPDLLEALQLIAAALADGRSITELPELAQLAIEKATGGAMKRKLSRAEREVFEMAVEDEQLSGASPATLASVLETSRQAPDDVVAAWYNQPEIADDLAAFIVDVEQLARDYGPNYKLSDLLRDSAALTANQFDRLVSLVVQLLNTTDFQVEECQLDEETTVAAAAELQRYLIEIGELTEPVTYLWGSA